MTGIYILFGTIFLFSVIVTIWDLVARRVNRRNAHK